MIGKKNKVLKIYLLSSQEQEQEQLPLRVNLEIEFGPQISKNNPFGEFLDKELRKEYTESVNSNYR